MEREDQLKLLKRDVDIWNQWRAENPQVVPDLAGADLSRVNLTLANLTNADLSSAKLVLANLKGADLRWAKLTKANLVGARLIGVDLQEADLSGADLRTAEDLTQEQLASTTGDDATVLPEGLQRPESWRSRLTGRP